MSFLDDGAGYYREVLPPRHRTRILRSATLALCLSVALLTGLRQCTVDVSRLDGIVLSFPVPGR